MKLSKSVKYSALFFLIFIFGIIFFVATINRSLNKKAGYYIQQPHTSKNLATTIQE